MTLLQHDAAAGRFLVGTHGTWHNAVTEETNTGEACGSLRLTNGVKTPLGLTEVPCPDGVNHSRGGVPRVLWGDAQRIADSLPGRSCVCSGLDGDAGDLAGRALPRDLCRGVPSEICEQIRPHCGPQPVASMRESDLTSSGCSAGVHGPPAGLRGVEGSCIDLALA